MLIGSTVRLVDAKRREWLDRMHALNASMGRSRYATNPAPWILLASVWKAGTNDCSSGQGSPERSTADAG
jgi:hypothetical protein